MAKVELTRRAEHDLRRLRRWLADENPAAAERASATILAALDRLALFPELGVVREGTSVRNLPVRFGKRDYVVRYAVQGDRVVIARVFHGLENR